MTAGHGADRGHPGERRGREDRPGEAEEQLRTLIDQVPVGIFISDAAGDWTFVNASLCTMAGFTPAEGRGRGWARGLHREDRERVTAEWDRAVASAAPFGSEFRLRRPDGSVIWLHGRAVAHRDATGRVIGHLGSVVETTERRRTEDRLEREQALLTRIVDTIPVMITLYEPTTAVLRLNREFERLIGWSAAEAAGESLMAHCYPDPAYRARVQEFMASCAEEWMDIRMMTRPGREIETSWANIRLPDGMQVGIGIDITQRKRAEEALRESEERFRMVADNISVLAWTTDRRGWATWYNQRWYEYTGTTVEEMQERGWQGVHHPDHHGRVQQKLARCLETGEAWEDTFPLRGRDGTYRWFLSRSVPIRDEHGEIIRWFGTNTDITERLQMEEALREADRRKDEFLATLAHELRNPLAPIRNALEIMRLAGDDRSVWESAHAIMDRQLRQMVRLIDDLLDLSRISRGKVELRRERVDLTVALRQAVETSRPLIESAGHHLSIEAPSRPVFVDGDLTRLSQVVSNLLNNAATYTDRGGRIVLALERGGPAATIRVRDSGRGIPAHMLAHVFEMFTQVDGPRHDGHGGLGIGLSIVRRLVEMHGGTVEARSDGPGMGSEFIVRLPAEELVPEEMPAPVAEEPARAPGGRRILVADDNADVATSLAMVLKIMGHDVRTARDGAEAVEVAQLFRPDLALLDIGMPKLDGYEVCRRIRVQPWGGEVCVVALTGWGQQEDRRRSREAGFDHHVVKPLEPAALEKLLAMVHPAGADGSGSG